MDLCPDFHAADETRLFTIFERLLGLSFAMKLFWVRLAIRRVKLNLRTPFCSGSFLRMRRVELLREERSHATPLGRVEVS